VALNPRLIRATILEQSKRAGVGHIGSALCIADIVTALYGSALRIPTADASERDRFILSKGHAALALYSALFLTGRLSREQLDTFCADDSVVGVHPEHALAGIDFCTGSLGHGLSMGLGAALAARMQGSARHVYVLMSDAECNEGSVWEAAMFAAHHRIANLIAIVDVNGQQALGKTANVLDLEPLGARWEAFGWHVVEADGHDVDRLVQTFADLREKPGKPKVVLARTIFGKGVSFMEGQIKWHYWPMNDDEYRQALDEVDG
jgi:transketolase